MTAIAPVTPLARALVQLDTAGVAYDLVEHTLAYTAAERARVAGFPESGTAKTLVLLDRGRVRVAVIPASRRLSLDRARRALRAGSHLRLAAEEEAIWSFLEFEVGALPPFVQEAVPEIVDVRLLSRDRILCPAGDHRHSVLLDPCDLQTLVEPRVADLCVPTTGVPAPRSNTVAVRPR